MKALWISRPKNEKTGPIPTAYIGTNNKECRDSCRTAKCPFLSKKDGGDPSKPTCYAYGTVTMGAASAYRAHAKNPARYELASALANRHPSAKYIRMSAIGDPVVLGPGSANDILSEAAAANLRVLGYTHGWRQGYWWKDVLRASCGSLDECDEAISQGWTASVVLPSDQLEAKGKTFTTPEGHRGVVCPAFHNGELTCNSCGMCAFDKIKVVGFPDHGPGSR
jgi:hypothetical protein